VRNNVAKFLRGNPYQDTGIARRYRRWMRENGWGKYLDDYYRLLPQEARDRVASSMLSDEARAWRLKERVSDGMNGAAPWVAGALAAPAFLRHGGHLYGGDTEDTQRMDTSGSSLVRQSPFYEGLYDACSYASSLSKDDLRKMQRSLIDKGYDLGSSGADGVMGRKTKAALSQFFSDQYMASLRAKNNPSPIGSVNTSPSSLTPLPINGGHGEMWRMLFRKDHEAEIQTPTIRQVKGFLHNFGKPGFMTDALLTVGDIAGLPSNATNYIRDLNSNIRNGLNPLTRIADALTAVQRMLTKGMNFGEAYKDAKTNPSWLSREIYMTPIEVNENNFSWKELQTLMRMASPSGKITNADVIRESSRGTYGSTKAPMGWYLTDPSGVVQTAVGQSSGRDGYITDAFDVNVGDEQSDRDNDLYKYKVLGGNANAYSMLRAIRPYTSSTSKDSDAQKIHTVVKVTK